MKGSTKTPEVKLSCVAPDEIAEGDLLAYLNHLASPIVVAHMARCAACTAEVADLKQIYALLAGAIPRLDCPSAEMLLAYKNNALSGAESRKIKKHLKVCDACGEELELLEVPWTENSTWLSRVQEKGKQLLQALLMPAGQPAPALRGKKGDVQVYQAGNYQLVLNLTPPVVDEKLWSLEGRLMRTALDESSVQGHVQILKMDEVIKEDDIDALGFFALDGVISGTYTLAVELPETWIWIEKLVLG